MTTKVLITGATGLLGRAVMDALKAVPELDVVGTAFSRATGDLRKVDLTDSAAVEALLREERPAVIIHCAAERRPDVVAGKERETDMLNVGLMWKLGQVADEINAWVLALSTDYVFDGTAPPYKHTDAVHPLNKYGRSKARGELALLAASPSAAVLRVGVLFGKTKRLDESAVTLLMDAVLKADAPSKVDAWAQRHPTYVNDVASVIRQMVEAKMGGGDGAGAGAGSGAGAGGDARPTAEDEFGRGMSGVFHWNSPEAFTKYEMACAMAEVLGRSASHLSPNHEQPGGAPRPRDCTLDVSRLASLGISAHTPFKTAVGEVLAEHDLAA